MNFKWLLFFGVSMISMGNGYAQGLRFTGSNSESILELNLSNCDIDTICGIDQEFGEPIYTQQNDSWFFTNGLVPAVIKMQSHCKLSWEHEFFPKNLLDSDAEFDPYDVLWLLSDALLRVDVSNFEHEDKGNLSKEFWNEYNSLNWRKGDFYFIAHRTTLRYDTIGTSIKRNVEMGSASIARLDTNDVSNSVILFDYPDPTAVIQDMFSFRVDCDTYRTFVMVEGKGIEEVDFENQKFIPYCSFYLLNRPVFGSSVMNGTWESCAVNIDLDLDDSSGEIDGGYRRTVYCPSDGYNIVDGDFDLYADDRIDSIHITIMNPLDINQESLRLNDRDTYTITGNNTAELRIVNEEPLYFVDLRYMLRELSYFNDARPMKNGMRSIKFEVFAGEDTDIAWTRLDIRDVLYAGHDSTIMVCNTTFDLNDYLSSWASSEGDWITEDGTSIVSILDTGSYQYYYVLENEGCINDTAKITLEKIQEIQVDYDIFNTTCINGADGMLDIVQVSGGIQGDSAEYKICVAGVEVGIGILNDLSNDEHLLEIKQNANCNLSETFFIDSNSELSVDLGDDIYIDTPEDSIDLEANIEADDEYKVFWYIDGELQKDSLGSYSFLPYSNTSVIVQIIDQDQCMAYDTIQIFVDNPIFVAFPNVIIPRDIIEEERKFNPFCSPQVKIIRSIIIVNRWGNTVYHVKNLRPNLHSEPWWDGTFKGEEAPGGVYHYKVLVSLMNGEELEYKGGLMLLR